MEFLNYDLKTRLVNFEREHTRFYTIFLNMKNFKFSDS